MPMSIQPLVNGNNDAPSDLFGFKHLKAVRMGWCVVFTLRTPADRNTSLSFLPVRASPRSMMPSLSPAQRGQPPRPPSPLRWPSPSAPHHERQLPVIPQQQKQQGDVKASTPMKVPSMYWAPKPVYNHSRTEKAMNAAISFPGAMSAAQRIFTHNPNHNDTHTHMTMQDSLEGLFGPSQGSVGSSENPNTRTHAQPPCRIRKRMNESKTWIRGRNPPLAIVQCPSRPDEAESSLELCSQKTINLP